MDKIEEITDEDQLLRRVVFPHPNYIKPDGTVTSFAFSLRQGEDGISVDVERLTTLAFAIQDASRYRLYGVKAEVPRALGLFCIHDPVEGNPAHALIKGDITKSVSRKLARAAERVLQE